MIEKRDWLLLSAKMVDGNLNIGRSEIMIRATFTEKKSGSVYAKRGRLNIGFQPKFIHTYRIKRTVLGGMMLFDKGRDIDHKRIEEIYVDFHLKGISKAKEILLEQLEELERLLLSLNNQKEMLNGDAETPGTGQERRSEDKDR